MPEIKPVMQPMVYQAQDGSRIAYELAGAAPGDRTPLIVWGHGWRQDRGVFAPLIQSLPHQAHLLIDFPGFGDSPPPMRAWGVRDYADAVAGLIAAHREGKVVWVGHSFGGRVGIRLAIDHPELVNGLFLIGSHGLKPRRGPLEALKLKGRTYMFKALKHLVPLFGFDVERLRGKFGSADYRAAGAFRPTFLKVIADDLTQDAPRVRCPVHLVYGALDRETPPEMGERFARLMPKAQLTVLPGQDHYSVLGAGRHPVLKRLVDFLETV